MAVRVLVVEDSTFMRRAIINILNSSPQIEVIDYATNGKEALEKALLLRPDVITADVEMPVMDGITFLAQIMKRCPTPVVMLSTLTQKGAGVTLKALSLGAVDFISKPSAYSTELKSQRDIIIEKVIAASRANIKKRKKIDAEISNNAGVKEEFKGRNNRVKAIFIGVSTGGPKTLYEIIPMLPGNIGVPIFIVQHMPAMFTNSFAESLDSRSKLKVKEAVSGEYVEPNTVYIAPGGMQMEVVRVLNTERIRVFEGPEDVMYKPSVDITGFSVARVYKEGILGIILTGMGSDGAEAFKFIKERGGITIAESESTAVIFGMPQAVIQQGNADIICPSYNIPNKVLNLM